MKKVGLVLLGLVVLLVVAVVAAPRLIDWNGYKPEIAQAVKEATGRTLVIGGDIELSIFPGISFRLSDVSLSNAEGAAEARMFTLESVRGKLALLPLISREVVVEELVIRAPVLHLSVDENGLPNWVFAGAAPAPAEAETQTPGDGGLPISGLRLGDVRLEDGLVTFRDARTGQEVVAKAITLKAALEDLSAPFTLDGSLTLNGEPVTLKVSLDSPGSLLGGGRASVETALEAPRFTLSYAGGLRQKPLPALDGTFDLSIPSVGKLAAWLKRPLAAGQPDPGPLKVHAVFEGQGAKMTLKEATIEGTALRAKASGSFDGTGGINRLTFTIEAGVLDLDRYLPPPAETAVAAEPGAKPPEKQGKRDPFAAIPDTPFDLAPFKQTEAEIKIAIGGVKAMGYRLGKVGLRVSLRKGVLTADVNEFRLYGGNVTGKLKLDGSGDTLGADTTFVLDKVNVGALARAVQGGQAKVAGIASGRLQAKGRGKSPRALVQSLVAAGSLSLGGIDVKDAPGALTKLDLTFDLPGVEANPSIKGTLVYNKEPVAFSLTLDPLAKVLSGVRFTTKLGVRSKRLNMSYDGAVQTEPVPGLDGRFRLDVPSVGKLLAWLENPLPKGQPDPGPLTVNAVLSADGPKVTLKEATIKGKALNAKASGSFDGSGEIARIVLNLEAGVLDLDRYLPPPAKAAKTDKPAARTAPAGGPLAALPDEPFDLTPLRKTEATISIRLGGLKAMGYKLGRTALTVKLKGAVLNATLKELRLYGGTVTGTVRLDGAGDVLGIDTALTIDKVDIGALARAAEGAAAKVTGVASATLKVKGRGKSPRALAESLSAKADLRLGGIGIKDSGMGTVSEATLTFDMPGFDRPIAVKGRVTYNKETVSLDVGLAPLKQVLSGQAFDLTAAVASDLLNARYGGKVQTEPVPGLDGRFDLDVPSVGRLAAWLGRPLDPAQPDPGPLIVTALMSADGAKAVLKEATIDGKAIEIRATARIDTSRAVTRFDATIDIIEADLNAYLPPQKEGQEKAAAPAGPAEPSGWSEDPFDVSPLRQAEGRAKVTIGRVRYGELDIENGIATLTLKKGVLKVVVEKLRMAGGVVDLSATVDGSRKVLAIDYEVKVTGVQARPVLKTFAGSDRLSGTVDFQTAGRAKGVNQKQMVETLNGQGRFEFKDGAIHGINIASALRKVKTLGFGESGEQKTDFAELSGSFTIRDGVLENRDLKMLAPLVRLTGSGLVPMPPRAVDYKAVAKLVGSLKGQGGEDALAGLPIPVTVKGSWDNPEIGVDWKSVFTEAALDPKRLTNMPENLRTFGASLGVKLPIPGASTGAAETGATGGILGGVLKMIPGLSSDQPPQQEPPQAQPQQEPPPPPPEEQAPSGFNPFESLKRLFGN
ncbi:MAG: AsmA family protein [Proteobacteria bacterium]|nr:AsmA family protein [Pseudomonadota bacterium]